MKAGVWKRGEMRPKFCFGDLKKINPLGGLIWRWEDNIKMGCK
jgi:hypothetical protein